MFVGFIEEIAPIRSEEGSDNENEKWNWRYDSSCWNISDGKQFTCRFSGTVVWELHEFHHRDVQIRNYEFLCQKRELGEKKNRPQGRLRGIRVLFMGPRHFG